MPVPKTLVAMTGFLMLSTLAGSGCATKKFVRQQTATVAQRIDDVDKKQAEALGNLEQKESKDISRVDERAMSAQNKADDAARAAQQADNKATEATQTARGATDLANQVNTGLGTLSSVVENIDRYKLLTTGDVLFGFDKAVLTKPAQEQLDQILSQTSSLSRWVIEVQGFTDRIGAQEYNLALSRRRADAVVRYLVARGVPLRNIHMIGLGKGQVPAEGQPVSRREAARQMRRVVVNLYAPEVPLTAPSAQTAEVQPSMP